VDVEQALAVRVATHRTLLLDGGLAVLPGAPGDVDDVGPRGPEFVPVGGVPDEVPTQLRKVVVEAAGVPDDLLGRVSSTITTASTAVTPVGMLVGGVVADRIGPATVLLAGGVGTLLMAGYYLVVPELRRFGPPAAVSDSQFAA